MAAIDVSAEQRALALAVPSLCPGVTGTSAPTSEPAQARADGFEPVFGSELVRALALGIPGTTHQLPPSAVTVNLAESIGIGSLGTVYPGTLDVCGVPEKVAIRVVSVRNRSAEFAKQATAELHRMCVAHERLSGHLIGLRGFVQEPGTIMLVYELARGSLLGELQQASFDAAPIIMNMHRWLETALALAEALQALHGLGVAHLDISPANVLRTRTGAYKLSDVGLAHMCARNRGFVSRPCRLGNYAYIAPEQCIPGQQPTEKGDMWSLAACLAHAWSGAPPFGDLSAPEMMYLQFQKQIPDLSKPELHMEAVREVLLRCFNYDADQRPSAAALCAQLRLLQDAIPAVPHAPTAAPVKEEPLVQQHDAATAAAAPAAGDAGASRATAQAASSAAKRARSVRPSEAEPASKRQQSTPPAMAAAVLTTEKQALNAKPALALQRERNQTPATAMPAATSPLDAGPSLEQQPNEPPTPTFRVPGDVAPAGAAIAAKPDARKRAPSAPATEGEPASKRQESTHLATATATAGPQSPRQEELAGPRRSRRRRPDAAAAGASAPNTPPLRARTSLEQTPEAPRADARLACGYRRGRSSHQASLPAQADLSRAGRAERPADDACVFKALPGATSAVAAATATARCRTAQPAGTDPATRRDQPEAAAAAAPAPATPTLAACPSAEDATWRASRRTRLASCAARVRYSEPPRTRNSRRASEAANGHLSGAGKAASPAAEVCATQAPSSSSEPAAQQQQQQQQLQQPSATSQLMVSEVAAVDAAPAGMPPRRRRQAVSASVPAPGHVQPHPEPSHDHQARQQMPRWRTAEPRANGRIDFKVRFGKKELEFSGRKQMTCDRVLRGVVRAFDVCGQSVTLLSCDGVMVSGRDRTVEDIEVEQGDVLELFPRVVGNIGVWAPPRGAVGDCYLQGATSMDSAPPGRVLEIVRAADGSCVQSCEISSRADVALAPDVLPVEACALLAAHIERCFAAQSKLAVRKAELFELNANFRFEISHKILSSLTASPHCADAVASLVSEDCRGLRYFLRRVACCDGGAKTAPPHLAFHRDGPDVGATASIALNGGSEYEGADVVFAFDDGQFYCPARPVGAAVVHSGQVVHGVTRMLSGVRYNLFVQRSLDVSQPAA